MLQPCQPQYFIGKRPARAAAAVHKVVNAVLPCRYKLADRVSHIPRVGRVPYFVGNNADLPRLSSAIQNGMNKIATLWRIKPGWPYDVVALQEVLYVGFTSGFGTAVGICWVARHPLLIPSRVVSRENFIGAYVEHLCTKLLTGQRYVLRAETIHPVGEVRIFGAAINMGVGGTVNKEVWRCTGNGRKDRFLVRYV